MITSPLFGEGNACPSTTLHLMSSSTIMRRHTLYTIDVLQCADGSTIPPPVDGVPLLTVYCFPLNTIVTWLQHHESTTLGCISNVEAGGLHQRT